MEKWCDIYYDKHNKTQRLILVGPNDCSATIEEKLQAMGIAYTNHKFIGRCESIFDIMSQTHRYALKWKWLPTIDLTKDSCRGDKR